MANEKEHKFNFSEEEKTQDQSVEPSIDTVAKDAKGLIDSFKKFMGDVFSFKQDTDRDATIDAIKLDIPFKGATAWILICSIFVASAGLNYNSTAVVIGAMLISPLMGPILGIGLSIAINDIDTLRKSLINFAVMVVLSILTAYLFFEVFPYKEDSSELLNRTRPDIRDVLIAFFGGLALIIARTKRGTIATVIFGVAIATALMPPLCTVGYGLAKGTEAGVTEGSTGYTYALGAMYLFTINTIFIALATFLVLKVLRFPMLKYANSKKRTRIARLATALAIIVMIPAIWTFYNVVNESNFNQDAKRFIKNELEFFPNKEWVKKNSEYKYQNGKDSSYILLDIFYTDSISKNMKLALEKKLREENDYKSLRKAAIKYNERESENFNRYKVLEDLRERDSLDLMDQRLKIQSLENEVERLSEFAKTDNTFESIATKVRVIFENVSSISYAQEYSTNFNTVDTLAIIKVKWKDTLIGDDQKEIEGKKLYEWLKLELKVDTLAIRRDN